MTIRITGHNGHSSGRVAVKGHTLDGDGAQADNLFQITGVVQILGISMFVDTVTDATTLTGVKFELDDGTAQVDITAGVVGSSVVAGSLFFKSDPAATAMELVSAAAGAIDEPAAGALCFHPFLLAQKTGDVNTYIRVAFTGDSNTDVDVTVTVRWEPISDGATLVAV